MTIACAVCEGTPEVCELCRPLVGWVRGGMLPPIICRDCWIEWYDPSEKCHDSWESVAEYVKRKRSKPIESGAK